MSGNSNCDWPGFDDDYDWVESMKREKESRATNNTCHRDTLKLEGSRRPRDDIAQLYLGFGAIIRNLPHADDKKHWQYYDWHTLAQGAAICLVYALERLKRRNIANKVNDLVDPLLDLSELRYGVAEQRLDIMLRLMDNKPRRSRKPRIPELVRGSVSEEDYERAKAIRTAFLEGRCSRLLDLFAHKVKRALNEFREAIFWLDEDPSVIYDMIYLNLTSAERAQLAK